MRLTFERLQLGNVRVVVDAMRCAFVSRIKLFSFAEASIVLVDCFLNKWRDDGILLSRGKKFPAIGRSSKTRLGGVEGLTECFKRSPKANHRLGRGGFLLATVLEAFESLVRSSRRGMHEVK